jgi:hypothetical protein
MPSKQRTPRVRAAAANGRSRTSVVDRSPEDSIRAYLSFLADPSASLDSRDIARLEKLVASTADPVEKLRLAAQLEQAKTPDGTVLQADFIRHARAWADTEGIPASAFRQLGVADDVLRKAGVLKGGRGVATRRRATAERTGRRVTVEDIKAWALTQPDIFTIKDVTQAIGGSLVTANKALQELVVEGTISNLGPAEDHKGPGRAPARFAVAKRRKARA